MGRIEQALQRARQSGHARGLESIPARPYDAASVPLDYFPDEAPQPAAAPAAPKMLVLPPYVPKAAAPPRATRVVTGVPVRAAAPKMLILPPSVSTPVALPKTVAVVESAPVSKTVATPQPLAAPIAMAEESDREIKRIFFNTYHENVWSGRLA